MRSILPIILLIASSAPSCRKPEKVVAVENGGDDTSFKMPTTPKTPEDHSNPSHPTPSPTDASQVEIEHDALLNWYQDPTAYFSKIQKLNYPHYLEATADEKKRIKTVTSGVGQMIGVPVDDRLEFIYKLIPNNETPFIVDEMIRVSDQSDLTKISDWLKKRGYSSARTELYRLIVDRMQRLGSDNQQIQAFIDSLEYEDEQTRVRKALADPSDVAK